MKTLTVLIAFLLGLTLDVHAQSHTLTTGPVLLNSVSKSGTIMWSGIENTFIISDAPKNDYRLDFYIEDEHTNMAENKTSVTVVPQLLKDEGKKARLVVSVREHYKYRPIETDTFSIKPPPFIVTVLGDIEQGDELNVSAWLGPMGHILQLAGGLELLPVNGYFEGGLVKQLPQDTASSEFGFLRARPKPGYSTSPYLFSWHSLASENLPKEGTDVELEFRDPLTHQQFACLVHVYPHR